MEFQLLGPLTVLDGDTELAVRGARQRHLLAVLLLRAGEVVPTDVVVERLWGDAPPTNPRNAVQALVSQLRRALGSRSGSDSPLVTRDPGYLIDLDGHQLDAHRFERLVRDGRRVLEAGDAEHAASILREALSMWRGEVLADVAHLLPTEAGISRLDELRLSALEAQLEADLALGDHGQVIGELQALTATDPLREEWWRLLILAMYRAGRQAEALRAYADCRRILIDELGVEPGPELRRLEAQVLAQDEALDPPPLRARTDQVARRSPTLDGNLRPPLSSLVGRGRELAESLRLSAAHRLVTLVGPGGAGKTRLVVEAGTRLLADPDVDTSGGVWMVELAPVLDEQALASAIAAALGMRDPSELAELGERSTLERVVSRLAASPTVLILDNCEHVVGAAAVLAEQLLEACPDLRILATSREGLGVPGEALWPVPPLPLDDAIALFAERARAVRHDLDDAAELPVISEICSRLDGLPLAIELAAARCRSLSPDQIAARLDDRFRLLTGGARTALPRQQTLRAVVDWSHDLLFEDERLLFARLSAFAGASSLEAVEAVCSGPGLPEPDVVDTLARLVDKSLLVAETGPDGTRYRLLQTLWHYSRERLVSSGEAERVRRRHLEHYRSVAEYAEHAMRGGEPPSWRHRVRLDIDNIRAALEFAVADDDATSALTIAVAMAFPFWMWGDHDEAVSWIDQALTTRGDVPEALRHRAVAWRVFEAATATPTGEERAAIEAAVAALREVGTPRDVGEGLLLLAAVQQRTAGSVPRSSSPSIAGTAEESLALLAEARQILADHGLEWGIAIVDLFEAGWQARVGSMERAAELARRAESRFDQLQVSWGRIESLMTIAMLAEARGDYADASERYERCLEVARDHEVTEYESIALAHLANIETLVGDPLRGRQLAVEAQERSTSPWARSFALNAEGMAARRAGDLAAAARCHAEAAAHYGRAENHSGLAYSLSSLGWCHHRSGDIPAALDTHARALASAASLGDPRAIALAVEGLSAAAAATGRRDVAAVLLGHAAHLRAGAGAPRPPGEQPEVDETEAHVRQALGDGPFATEAAKGAAMALDDLLGLVGVAPGVAPLPMS